MSTQDKLNGPSTGVLGHQLANTPVEPSAVETHPMVYISWVKFSSLALPDKAALAQRVGMRTSFYSGAAAMFVDLIKLIDANHFEPPPEMVRWLEARNAELQQWQNETVINDKTFGGGTKQ